MITMLYSLGGLTADVYVITIAPGEIIEQLRELAETGSQREGTPSGRQSSSRACLEWLCSGGALHGLTRIKSIFQTGPISGPGLLLVVSQVISGSCHRYILLLNSKLA